MDQQENDTILWFFEVEDYESVLTYASNLISVDDNDYLAYGARGKAYWFINEADKALSDLNRSIELNQNYCRGYENRALCFFDKDQYEETTRDILASHVLGAANKNWDILGISYYFLGRDREAISALTYSIDLEEKRALVSLRADLHFKVGDSNHGFLDIEHALSCDRDEYNSTNRILHLNKPWEESIHVADQACLIASTLLESLNLLEVDLGSLSNLRGIYVIQFQNSEYYVGQTKRLADRIKQHQVTYKDIDRIYFRQEEHTDLTDLETLTISHFEKNLIRIRNIKQIRFTNIFGRLHQQLWIESNSYNFVSGRRFDNNAIRLAYRDRFHRLQESPYLARVVNVLTKYIKKCIPNYTASEYNYWTLSCFPKHLEKHNFISRININTVCVLSLYHKENELKIMFVSSKLPFLLHLENGNHLADIFKGITSVSLELRDGFEASENDEILIHSKLDDFEAILANEVVCTSIRAYNLRMMNHAGLGTDWKRQISHCVDLADLVLEET